MDCTVYIKVLQLIGVSLLLGNTRDWFVHPTLCLRGESVPLYQDKELDKDKDSMLCIFVTRQRVRQRQRFSVVYSCNQKKS